jgi:hypothetical protein
MTIFLFVGLLLPRVGAAVEDRQVETASVYDEVEKKWGIKPLHIRLTGAEHFLDFRYLVVDAEKAKLVTHKKKKAILIDEETGERYHVTMTKIGAMRGTTTDPKPDKRYFILFTNTDQCIKRGKTVTVMIDDCKVENLKVE